MSAALVDYLRAYGPLPSGNAQFDEHVTAASDRYGVRQLEIQSPLLEVLYEHASRDLPHSLILTGTAGDGKTYHCRKILKHLGADLSGFADQKRFEHLLKDDRTLVVIKDLTELRPYEKTALYPELVEAFTDPQSNKVFILAANDGQLLAFLRAHESTHANGPALLALVRTLLQEGREREDGWQFEMLNLSRQTHDSLLDTVITAVVDHPLWDDCNSCSVGPGACPIQRNRRLLADQAKPGLRSRLSELVLLAACNDTHLPLRQLLLLCVNTILGHERFGLMTCANAQSIVAQGESPAFSNPYRNALGLNFTTGERERYAAFSVLEGLALGAETNNGIDHLLLEQLPQGFHGQHVANDTVFGAALFEPHRSAYVRGQYENLREFREAMADQRRRLFFVAPRNTTVVGATALDPWLLTSFKSGGDYLKFRAELQGGAESIEIKRKLTIGLNRAYSGLMCDDDDRLWLTAPAGSADSRLGRILDTDQPIQRGAGVQERLAFDFDAKGVHGRPRLVMLAEGKRPEALELTPLLFEYLLRIEAGSLPASFSRQCFEDLRHFRLRAVATLNEAGLGGRSDREIALVKLTDAGRLERSPLPLLVG
jgi:hypothetical protein